MSEWPNSPRSRDQHPEFGTPFTIRSIQPEDAPRLQVLVARLLSESIYFRFLEYLKSLTPEKARELANADYQRRMAFVAALTHEDEEQVIAVARYSAAGSDQPASADVGMVVENAYQSQSLGIYLLKRLTNRCSNVCHKTRVSFVTTHSPSYSPYLCHTDS